VPRSPDRCGGRARPDHRSWCRPRRPQWTRPRASRNRTRSLALRRWFGVGCARSERRRTAQTTGVPPAAGDSAWRGESEPAAGGDGLFTSRPH
jgi:hypothetical protein